MAAPAKVFRVSKGAAASLWLQEKSAALIGDDRHYVLADEQGITLKGPISIVADSMGIRRGGLWVGLNDFVEMIPSTIMTPIPSRIPFPPIFGLVGLGVTVAFFTSMLV